MLTIRVLVGDLDLDLEFDLILTFLTDSFSTAHLSSDAGGIQLNPQGFPAHASIRDDFLDLNFSLNVPVAD